MLQRGDLHGAVALTTEAEPFAEAPTTTGARRARGRQGPAELLRRLLRRVARPGRAGDRRSPTASATSRCASSPAATPASCSATSASATGTPGCTRSCELAIEAGNAVGGGDVAQRPRPPDRWSRATSTGAERRDRGARSRPRRRSRRDNRFALAVLSCTRSEIRLRAGRAEEALADAERAVDLLTAAGDPNPYLLAMSVVIEVQALLALGRLDEAERSGQRAVERLGDRVPQARSMILSTVAAALREAGRTEQAYDVLTPERRGRAARLPGAVGAAARARARHAGDARRAPPDRRAGGQEPRARGGRARARRGARRRSSSAEPTATGSPACTTAATSRASSAATRRRRAPARSASPCSTSTTSRTSTTASATTPATRCSCASPRCCSAACAARTSWCAPAARSSCS